MYTMTFNLSPYHVTLHIEDDDGDDGDVDDPWQNVHDDFQPLSRPSPTAPSRATSLTSALRGHFRYALGMMIMLVMVVLKRMRMITVLMVVVIVMMMLVVVVMVMMMVVVMVMVMLYWHQIHGPSERTDVKEEEGTLRPIVAIRKTRRIRVVGTCTFFIFCRSFYHFVAKYWPNC